MPALGTTYIKFVGTNADIRKGSVTGLPVSGCIDESTTSDQPISLGCPHPRTLSRLVVPPFLLSVDPDPISSGLFDELVVLGDVFLSVP